MLVELGGVEEVLEVSNMDASEGSSHLSDSRVTSVLTEVAISAVGDMVGGWAGFPPVALVDSAPGASLPLSRAVGPTSQSLGAIGDPIIFLSGERKFSGSDGLLGIVVELAS